MTGERVERRLAAVLASDVAGYSRLMGGDEEGTLARLKAVRKALVDPTIASHRGRIVKTTGDGMLVEFASAVDAARCAVEVQRGMVAQNADVPQNTRIEFRIGIHVGDIIFDDNDIFGDGVNIAARLEGIAQPGGVCISSSAYDQVRGKVTVEFTDMGEQSLKNIARPVRAYAVVLDGVGPKTEGGGSTLSAPSAPRLSIVVLPFAKIGGDPEQEYFVDGVTESLTTDLSRISGAFVIARNTAFTFKGKAVDVKQVGRELNVRYVLEGSVQRSGNRLRVNVQLIDAGTGNHIWAERFDKPVIDLFDMQDEIVSRLANTLGEQLIDAEARRAENTLNPDAVDFNFQGWAFLNKGINLEHNAQARSYFRRALLIDPCNVEALLGSAVIELYSVIGAFTDDRSAAMAAAEAAANKALSLAPNHANAHFIFGSILGSTNRIDRGIAECERALTLDRNLAYAHATIGSLKYFVGRGSETESHVREALRLSPRDTHSYQWISFVGIAKLWEGGDTEAVLWLRRSIEANPNYSLGHFYLAAALAHLGEIDEAQSAVCSGLLLHSSFTISRYRASAACNHPAYLAGRERTYAGLRLAGLPE